MKNTAFLLLISSPLLCGLPGAAFAQCGGYTDPIAGSALAGKLVCANRPGEAGDPNQRWSEMHYANGTLGEWGRGSNDPAGSYDENVGSWSYSGASITYDYDSQYTWTLYGNSGTPGVFCDEGSVKAEIKQANDIPLTTTLTNPCGW